jgi:hypothetical protein
MTVALLVVAGLGAGCSRGPVAPDEPRLGLELTVVEAKGRHQMEVRIVNRGADALTLVARVNRPGQQLAAWIRNSLLFETDPLVPETSNQVYVGGKPPPPLTYQLSPGAPLRLAWETGDELRSAPGYPIRWSSPGLFRIRARITLEQADGARHPLASEWQPFTVGGSHQRPKTGVGRVIRVSGATEAWIDLGADDRIEIGDRFRCYNSKAVAWELEVVEAQPSEARCRVGRAQIAPGFTQPPGSPWVGIPVEIVTGP